MAQVVKFRRGSTDTSLLDTSGWHIDPSWLPAVAEAAEEMAGPVAEVLRVHSNFADQDSLAAALVSLNQLRQDVFRYMRRRAEDTPVWLHESLANETGERRALVRQISIRALTEQHGPGGTGSMIDARPAYELGVEREAYWEAIAHSTMYASSLTAAAVATYDYTASPGADVVGDAPARIHKLTLQSTTSNAIDRFWVGLRSENKHPGGVAHFEPIWECEDGTVGTDAQVVNDATASPGGGGNTKVTVTPGTAADSKRLEITLYDVAGNVADEQYGEFLWLLRAKVGAGTWYVYLRWGYQGMADADFVQGRKVEVSSTSWEYHEMGIKPIPLRNLQALGLDALGEGPDVRYEVQVWGEQTAGSGILHVDCLCLIPLDEGFMKISGAALGLDHICVVGCGPRGLFEVLCTNFVRPAVSANRFYLPVGDGRMFITYAQAAASTLTDTITVNPFDAGRYYPRWAMLRGAE
jgi:hypothetical protein